MSGAKPGAPRVLHVFGSFGASDPQACRAVRVMNALGGRLRHTVVSAGADLGALDLVERGVPVEHRREFPALRGMPLPGRLQAIARTMIDYHLVLTHGRGASDAALARTMFSEVHALPPLIHHEDGSDESTAERRGLRSRWSRRIALGKAAGLVVPTETMEGVALEEWQQPLGRVKLIRDGVDLEGLAKRGNRDALPRLQKRAGERWIGAIATPGSAYGLAQLIAALPRTDPRWHLVVIAEGAERAGVLAAAGAESCENRVHVVAPMADHAPLLRLADLVAVAGSSEPLPLVALEAMGAGLPVIAQESGEIVATLADDNAGYVVAPGDSAGLATALERLAGDEYLRKAIGKANRERALAGRGAAAMIAAYRRLYASALGRDAI